MSSRLASPFDELLERSRRELDTLYQDAAAAMPGEPGGTGGAPPLSEPAAPAREADGGGHAGVPGDPVPEPLERAAAPASPPPPSSSRSPLSSATPVERLLDERYGDGWRFEITSRRREGNEAIVVGALRLPGTGGVRTQFGSAPITASGGGASGSIGGVAFSFREGESSDDPRAVEEAAFERARQDALANCAATTQAPKEA